MSDEPPDEVADGPETIGFNPRAESVTRYIGSAGPPPLRASSDEEPAPAAAASEDLDRYQVIGELAQGGMGVVLRSRDVDLGRDVAMKVLHSKYRERPELVDRFLEEAQIGGQLEHPGIVPVYDVGTGEDGRPFFTMKLIKGRTLADLLAGRASPDDDRREFLKQFHSVCNAMAFAHSRGVVHRDLKPANVMVGGFGEVLVLDWGLGKVLEQGGVEDERKGRRSHSAVTNVETVRSGPSGSNSLVGSVFGTPSYMPPEQARGEVETLDRRSDVFALGAILCEILTGAPPYAGVDSEILQRAARADLTEAHARLDGCGVAAELVALTKECLAPEMGARPESAGEVAERIGAHLVSVIQRARQAHLEAAEAHVRAEKLKRSRRLTNAIAATGIAAVTALALTGAWIVRDGSARREETEQAVFDALAEANLVRGRAVAAGTSAAWQKALASAEHAASVAAARAADEATLAKTERVLEEMHAALAGAEEREAQAERHAAMQRRGDEMRISTAEWADNSFKDNVLDGLREYGIDLEELSVDEAAARIRASPLRVQLVAGLAGAATTLEYKGRGEAKWHEIAVAAVDEPWLKDFLRTSRPTIDVVNDVPDDVAELSPMIAYMVATRLGELGDTERALELGRAALRAVPDDRLGHASYARQLAWARPPRRESQSRHATANVAQMPGRALPWQSAAFAAHMSREFPRVRASVRRSAEIGGESVYALGLLAFVESLHGDQEAASEALERARKLSATNPFVPTVASLIALYEGDLERSETEARVELMLNPGAWPTLMRLGRMAIKSGRLDEAESFFDLALSLRPKDSYIYGNRARLFALRGRFAAAAKEYRVAVQYPQAPEEYEDRRRVLELYGAMAAVAPRLTEYRMGEYAPTSAREWMALAEVAYCRDFTHASVGLFEAAFAADPRLADAISIDAPLHAARAALSAAAGRGKDAKRLSADERRRLRELALVWLDHLFSGWEARIEADWLGWSERLEELVVWYLRLDLDLETMRSSPVGASMSESERAAWSRLWERLDEFQRRIVEPTAR